MAKNPLFEQALTKQGVNFKYEEKVLLDDIDEKAGLRNQARLENPLDPELVEAYKMAYDDGDEFPPLVLWRPGKGKFRCVDGNHRLAAKKASKKLKEGYIDAYVILCDDAQVVDRITWTFNNHVNGRRLSYEECLQHALTFVRKYGMTIEAASKEWGVKKWELHKETRAEEVKEVLDKNNVKSSPVLTRFVLNELAGLRPAGEDVLTETAKVIAEVGATQGQVNDLLKEVKAAKNTQAKFKVISDFKESEPAQARKAETKGGRIKPQSPRPCDRLVQLIKEMSRLIENYPAKVGLQPPSHVYKDVRPLVEEVVDKLIEVFGLGAKVSTRQGQPERKVNNG